MSSMKSQAVSGARWTVGARLMRALIGIGTMAVLARFLSPADYGIMALILFITSFAQMLADFGLRVALVQRKEVTEAEKSSVFWINLAFGLLLLILSYVFAAEISALFGAPGLETPLRQVSPVFVLNALQSVSMSVLERRFDFRSIALAEIAGGLCGAATAVIMVLLGYRIEAIVMQQLVFTGVGVLLILWLARWIPRLVCRWSILRPLLEYGGYVALGSGTQFISNQIDRPILVRAISPTALGYFAVANQIVLSPMLIVVQAVARVLFPVLSAIQDDLPRTRQAYLNVLHAIMAIMGPVCLGLVAVADPFVTVLLGPGWDPVVPLIMLMAFRGLFAAFGRVNGSLLSAQGQARLQFRWSILSAIVSALTLLIAAPHGVITAIAAQTCATCILSPVYGHLAMRQIGQGWSGALLSMARPLLAAGAMCLAVRGLLHVLDLPTLFELILGILFGAVIYAIAMLLIDREKTLTLIRSGLARGSRPTGPPPAS